MMRAVALGRHQRALLIEAEAGPTPISKPGLGKEAVRRRREAAAGLVRLDLARQCITRPPYQTGGVLAIELTEIGRRLVDDFEAELATGERMRWGAKGWQTVRASEGSFGDDAPSDHPGNDPQPAPEAIPTPTARRSSSMWAAMQAVAALVLTRAA